MTFRLPVLLAGSLCVALPGLHAQFTWTGAGNTSSVFDPLNWQNASVPLGLGGDNVTFGNTIGSQHNIEIPLSMALNDIVFGGTNRPGYTFDGTGITPNPTLTLNGKVTVGSGADVRFRDKLNLNLATGNRVVEIASGTELRLDGNVGGAGTLVKTGAGTLDVRGDITSTGGAILRDGYVTVDGGTFGQSQGNLVVGSESGDFASLSLSSGAAAASASGTIGVAVGSTGFVTLSSSSWDTTSLSVGQAGAGALSLTENSSGTSSEAFIGQAAGGSGVMLLQNSTWLNRGNFTVGDADGSFGLVLVSGTGASLENTGANLLLGNEGNGTAVLTDGGSLSIGQGSGTLTLGSTISGSGALYIGMIGSAGIELDNEVGTGGLLNAAEVTTGSGSGLVTFNTVSSSTSPYYFTKDGSATGGAIKITGATQVSHEGGYTVLTGANTYTGDTVVTGGTLATEGNNVLSGLSNLFLSAATTNGSATLDLRGYTQLIGALTIGGATDSTNEILIGRNGSLRLGGDVTVTTSSAPSGAWISDGQLDLGGARTFDVGDSAHAPADLTVTSTIVGANSALVKTGPGTMVLTGPNTYNGGTTLTGGKLIASSSTALGSGLLTLNGGEIVLSQGANLANAIAFGSGGGRLGGNGTFGAFVTIGNQVSLAPGESAGTTTFTNGLTWAAGGSYDVEIVSANGAPGTGYDTLVIAGGGFNITANLNGQFNLNLISLGTDSLPGDVYGFDPSASYSWLIASSSNAITGFSADAFAIHSGGFTNSLGNGGVFSVALDGSNTSLYLNFTPIPEPSTYALLAAGAVVLFVACRRRKA